MKNKEELTALKGKAETMSEKLLELSEEELQEQLKKDRALKDVELEQVAGGAAPYRCHYCGKEFSTLQSLGAHEPYCSMDPFHHR